MYLRKNIVRNAKQPSSVRTSGQKSGFTLVELAIVLLVIGLMLSAVLKGQEMIENARVKNIVKDLLAVSTAYHAYLDRYKAIPGDDKLAASHVAGGIAGDGNGVISGTYTDANDPINSESNAYWQHTRLAGFMTGEASISKADPPRNPVRGILGVQSGSTAALIYGMSGNVVCTGSIPWSIAQAVDIMIDDGDSENGTVRTGPAGIPNQATAATTSAVYGEAVAAPVTGTLHTLCMKL